jgi:hypothetical protein
VSKESQDPTEATWPEAASLGEVQSIMAPHPAIIELESLLAQCRITAHRRGGPGGQHRNKVNSAVLVLHEPTGVSAEANERRDQTQNRRVAIDRLRLRLALTLRSEPTDASDRHADEAEFRKRWTGRPLKINEANFDHIAVLAILLDDLHRAGGQPSLVAGQWRVSTTSVVQFIASHPPAFQLVNRWRAHHGRSPLR